MADRPRLRAKKLLGIIGAPVCPVWFQYQKSEHQVRQSSGSRSWTQANKPAREEKGELEARERGDPVNK
jgi:hypothetical protein